MDYTIHEAAQLLGIDIKTLNRWLKAVGIRPRVDPSDRRRRLLTQDDLSAISSRLRRDLARRSPETAATDVVNQRLDALERSVQSLWQRLSQHAIVEQSEVQHAGSA